MLSPEARIHKASENFGTLGILLVPLTKRTSSGQMAPPVFARPLLVLRWQA